MKVRTAFEAAIAKFPERERRVALASFVARYAMPSWPVTDYRCVGLDADVIKEFLGGCGLRENSDYEDVKSALDPSAHMVKWKNERTAARLASLLSAMLPDDASRAALYIAQLDGSRDFAPGLVDKAGSEDGGSTCWDPLGLVESTCKIAERLAESAGKPGSWAKSWLAKRTLDREVVAPLWVLEAAAGVPGLFSQTTRSAGEMATVPFSLGRYVTRGESLKPPFPAIASYPIASVWGSSSHHRFCPLDGYVQRTAGDLEDIPRDAPGVSEENRRDAWVQVESAYVSVDLVDTVEKIGMLVHPKELWDHVVSLYEKAYGRRVVLVPDACHVHSGRVRGDGWTCWTSSLDKNVALGGNVEVRASVVFLNEAPDASKPSGSELVGAGERNLVLMPGEHTPNAEWEHSDAVLDDADAAAEWYAMTHAGCGYAPRRSHRTPGGDPNAVAEFRAWAAGPHTTSDGTLPNSVAADTAYQNGYNGVMHAACGIVDDVVCRFKLSYISPTPDKWTGANAEMHMAPKPVASVYSTVLDDGSSLNLLGESAVSASKVTAVLDALADPAVQLATPESPKTVQVVFETNAAYPASGIRMSSDNADFLKNVFLWGFQANMTRDRGLTLLAPGCNIAMHSAMRDEIDARHGQYHWAFLWGSAEKSSGYEAQIGSNASPRDVVVRALKDSLGRLVLVFGMKLGSPAEATCRAAFRWFSGLPLLTNESMKVAAETADESYIRVTARYAATALSRIVSAHMASGASGVVPGWTGVRTREASEYTNNYTVPEREMYEALADQDPTPLTAALLASRA